MPPTPPVPPTPSVPLSALLARTDLGLTRLAGPTDGDVHWAHASELADPLPYLLGGELLLTAGVHVPPEAGAGYFDAYVERIVAAGGAALGFGVAPVHDTVPAALVAACEARGLPLLEVPRRTTFSAVARAVGELVARARLAELRRVAEAQRSLASAASRPDPVPSVLRQLAGALGGLAVLLGPDGTVGAAAGREPGLRARAALAELARVVRSAGPGGAPPGACAAAPGPSSATDTVDGTHLTVYALGSGTGYALGLATARREPGDHTIASAASVLLALLTAERGGGPDDTARSAALVRLLLGAAPRDVAELVGGDRWTLVHGCPDGGLPDAAAAAALGAALGSELVDPAGGAEGLVRVLVPADRPVERLAGWTLGVSAVVGPEGWPAADAQAARALGRARATRAALVRHGSGGRITDLVPRREAEEHARALLAPIAGTPALPRTLRAWLSLHGSWDRTAVALSVHRNTVRQRIARCAALLEADLDDPDVRMELWFALRRLPD
ncbi:PucR family transcriptional regulator [Streptomyces abyssomicinicus]|uniref:PucR family transcriptional regulator n=1 Tax=Streptomyces abyssomicinicus TaxID=574929 RepID=UPI00124F9E75|nr:PucR family transcriptional regulator [Streptomyces abyssomicinicus]